MVQWAIVFIVIAAAALLFGFWGIASVAWGIARIILFVVVVVVVLNIVFRRRT
jgi:uncharacterized membrane protein YtjA (UPF0391 family)